jgi:hypothetical protein
MFTGCSGGKEEGKSDLWKTFDLVVGTPGDQKEGGYRSKRCVILTIWNGRNNTKKMCARESVLTKKNKSYIKHLVQQTENSCMHS